MLSKEADDKAAEFRALRDDYKLRNHFEAPPSKDRQGL